MKQKRSKDERTVGLSVGHFIKMGYELLYNYEKCHHLVFHNLQI